VVEEETVSADVPAATATGCKSAADSWAKREPAVIIFEAAKTGDRSGSGYVVVGGGGGPRENDEADATTETGALDCEEETGSVCVEES
jgi:hypothetical protein